MAFYMKTIYGCIGEAGCQQSVALMKINHILFYKKFLNLY